MAWVQQQQFNLGEVSPGAAIKSGVTAQAGLKELRNGLVRYDNTVEKRPGSLRVKPDVDLVDGLGTRKFIPFYYKGSEYLVVLASVDFFNQIAGPVRTLFVYRKQGTGWTDPLSETPLECWSIDGDALPPTYDFRQGGVSTAPHPYREGELSSVRYVSYKDKLVLLHENHLPLVIYPDDYEQIYNPLVAEPWRYETRFFESGTEVGGNRNPAVFTLSSRLGAAFARVTSSRPVFAGDIAPIYPSTTALEPDRYGAIYRIGGATLASTTGEERRRAPYGAFYIVDAYVGPSTADLGLIQQEYGATNRLYQSDLQRAPTIENDTILSDESEVHDWAGPWIDSGEAPPTPFTPPPTLAWANGETRSFLFTNNDAGSRMVGEMWVRISDSTGQVYQSLLCVSAFQPFPNSPQTVASFVNVGMHIDAGQLSLPNLHVMRPSQENTMAVVNGGAEVGSGDVRVTFWASSGLPEGHEEAFERIPWSGTQTTSVPGYLDVGGLVFINDGVLRLTEVASPPNQPQSPTTTWRGVWQIPPTSAGPTSSWGYGWSKKTGFPSVGVTHQQRLVLSGFKSPGGLFVASTPNNPRALNPNKKWSELDAPISVEVAGTEDGERVRWLASASQHLRFGTSEGEYSLQGVPLSSSAIGIERHSRYGADEVIGGVASVGPTSAFISQGGTALREMQSQADTGQFVSPNVLSFSDHILADGESYVDLVGVGGRTPLYGLRTSAGRLILMSRDIEQEILAPSPVETGERKVCEQIWKMPAVSSTGDSLWALWKYTTTTGDSNFVLACYEPGVYMDNQFTLPAGSYSPTEIPMPDEYAGRTVQLVQEGVWVGDFLVPDEASPVLVLSSPLPFESVPLLVGEPYTFKATPAEQDTSYRDGSTTAGKIKQVNNMRLYVIDSVGGDVVEDNTSQVMPAYQGPLTVMSRYTGWVDVPGVGVNGRDIKPSVQSRHPFPFRLGAICMEMSIR